MRITAASALSALALWGTFLAAAPALAGDGALDQAILRIQEQWAHVNYEVTGADKLKGFTALEQETEALAKQYPDRPEPLIWQAISLSTHAGAKGGLGALSMAKSARELLLAAEKIDPNAMHGSIYTTLGSLYHKVPGWPIGFGDDAQAEKYLKKALTLNPNGIDANYFYGELLFDQHQYAEASKVLRHALEARPRPDRPIADRGRTEEVRNLLARVEAELGGAETVRSAAR